MNEQQGYQMAKNLREGELEYEVMREYEAKQKLLKFKNSQQNIKDEIRTLEKEIDSYLKPYYEYENEFLKNFDNNSLLDKFVDWYNKDLSRQIRLRFKYSVEFGLYLRYELSLDLLQQNLNETQRVKLVRVELLDKLYSFYNQFLIEYRIQLQNELKEWRE